jgi:hypothetical protein
MSHRIVAVAFLLITTAMLAPTSRTNGDEPSRDELERLKRLQEVERNLARRLGKDLDKARAAKDQTANTVELLQDITVLQMLYQLKVTPAQRKALQGLAKETASKSRTPKDVKVSDELRKTLVQLHAALLKEDDDQIDKLGEKLDKLREAEGLNFEDDAEITEAARRAAPGALRLLSARQVAVYLGNMGDEVSDPLEVMVEALGKVRGLPEDEWKELRDDVSDKVALMVAGLDDGGADEVSEQVAALLIEARNLKDEEFKAKRAMLEKSARKILGDLGPTDVLRNFMVRTLAELLSNPRLPAVLELSFKG